MIINSRHSFYTSDLWKKCKQQVLFERVREDGGVYCEHCGKLINTSKQFNSQSNENRHTMIFHHKIELTDTNYMDYEISLNPKNIQIVHFKCHNQIHSRFTGGTPKKKIYIVYGSPCSGKSTWVKEQLSEQDLVADIDDIWEVVSKKPRYIKPNAYRDLVFALWNEYLEQIKMRTGFWNNAYIIMGKEMALSTDRPKIAERYNAELIHIDTPKEQCLQNLYNNPQGRDIQSWQRFIEEYFDKFTE